LNLIIIDFFTNPDAIDAKRRRSLLLFAAATAVTRPVLANSSRPIVSVLAASDLSRVLPSLIRQFGEVTGLGVRASYGSSGNFTRQIKEGLPFDVFLSADRNFVDALQNEGFVQAPVHTLAVGRLALVSSVIQSAPSARALLSQALVAEAIDKAKKVAIAHPDHAPYGRAAQQALAKWGLWDVAQAKLVRADNAAQAAQFSFQGLAQTAFVPVALVAPPHRNASAWPLRQGAVSLVAYKVPALQHAPLLQGIGVATKASPAALRFSTFLRTTTAQQSLLDHGFDLLPA
jgi:molybdate transport system substrate-binding protein